MRRLWVLIALGCGGGCWPSDDLIDGLTPAQWDRLRGDLTPHLGDACLLPSGETMPAARCSLAVTFGQQLFFEPALSSTGMVSCATCHDPKGFFIDTRPENNVSLGTVKWTKRNSSTMVNLGLRFDLGGHRGVFTADGQRTSPGAVLENAVTGPMGAHHGDVANVIRHSPSYTTLYNQLFGSVPGPTGEDELFTNLEVVFDAYFRRLVSIDAPFDRYLAGDPTAIDDAAKRGFGVFVGRGTCLECHTGPLLSDLDFHNTGVPQTGAFVPTVDAGRSNITMRPGDAGKFLTGSLRNIAKTGPYMHDGALATLGDVIAFYRAGGSATGYAGIKDPRIVPLDLTDDEVHDLEAFLGTLTGTQVPDAFTTDIRAASSTCPLATQSLCAGICVDEATDAMNCGACGHRCDSGDICTAAMCRPPLCSPGLTSCPAGCVDVANDPQNCGFCGHTCPTYCMGGTCG